MRAFKKADERFIQGFTTVGIDQTFQAEQLWGWVVRFSEDQRAKDFERVAAADSDDGNPTAARRSGQSNNSVIRNSHNWFDFKLAKGGEGSVGRSRL